MSTIKKFSSLAFILCLAPLAGCTTSDDSDSDSDAGNEMDDDNGGPDASDDNMTGNTDAGGKPDNDNSKGGAKAQDDGGATPGDAGDVSEDAGAGGEGGAGGASGAGGAGGGGPGGGTVTFKIDGMTKTTTHCDYVGKRPGDAAGILGSHFLCRVGVAGLPSVGLSIAKDTASGATVMCGALAGFVGVTVGAEDQSVYSAGLGAGACSITVTTHGAGPGDSLVGTFGATLNKIAGAGPAQVEITDGSFDLTRAD